MNIFEFLGLPSTHRNDKKVVQLVKHFDEVNPKAEQGIYHKKVSFPMYAQVKKDGVFCSLVIRGDNKVSVFNRTGKRMTHMEYIENEFEMYAAGGFIDAGVYFGEVISESGCSLEELSGVINPNRINPLSREQVLIKTRLNIHFFDEVTLEEFIDGKSERSYMTRYQSLVSEMSGNGSVLSLYEVGSESELRELADSFISQGEEGVVAKQGVGWLAGAKDWHQMKIVRSITYDLECIGYEEGTGKYEGKVANLLLRFKEGKVVKAMLGKGWTHEAARDAFLSTTKAFGSQPHLDPIGKIYEVYGLQPSSKNGLIRLPKVGELRHDKSESDF